MSDFLYTILWVTVYSIPSFLLQLFLCFKVKNRFFRLMPAYIAVAGWLLAVDTYFNFSGLHSGWNELAAFFVGCYVAIYTLGVAVAFVSHKIYTHQKNKKR